MLAAEASHAPHTAAPKIHAASREAFMTPTWYY